MEHGLPPIGIGNEGREVFWNAEHFELFLFLFTGVALAIFAYGVYRRWQMWNAMGKPEFRGDHIKERIWLLLKNALLQLKTFEDIYPGIMHGLIFFGFIVLTFGAFFDASEFHITEPLGFAFLRGKAYLFFTFMMQVFGLALLTGIIMALYRRYVQKPERLTYKGESDSTLDDAIVLILIGTIILTGFLIKGLRIYVTRGEAPWEVWSFGGWMVSYLFTGVSTGKALALHKLMWWFHTFLALGLIAYIPYSRLIHIITTSANHFMASLNPVGQLEPIRDFENAETFGVGTLDEFTKKQIFDSDACTRCGRCQDGCPAYLSGKHLSPKKVVQDIKNFWLEKAPAAAAVKREKGEGFHIKLLNPVDKIVDDMLIKTKGGEAPPEKALVGEVIDLNSLWDCTNCMYCMENCSSSIEHVPKIVSMRQYKVLTEADFAPELQLTYRNMENNSNPWGVGAHLRAEWAQGLDIPTLAENPNVEYLFYVGCAGSFDDRGKKVSIAVAKILKTAGVSFGILGTEESCCGDSAMRGGNEYLYQTLAQANIEVMNTYGVKKIICTCPHGYNAIKKDYPHFGGNFEVYHHSEIIADLIAQGKIRLTKPVEGLFTYHDSCFLGRYNNIYDQPRRILNAVPGMRLTEMDRNFAKSFCCGAGGARMWMEEHGTRINNMRAQQAIEKNADGIAVGCPFCLTMMSDGLKDNHMEEKMVSLDIAEIVWKSMGLEEEIPVADVCAAPAE